VTLQGATTRTMSYSYDGLYRLQTAVETGATTNSYSYTYDRAGNRTRVTVNGLTTNFTYTGANRRTDLSYDAAGNLLNDGTTTYSYDALNRMVSQGGVAHAYNGDGVLVRGASPRPAPSPPSASPASSRTPGWSTSGRGGTIPPRAP
jgi:YD repeat-containing protein